jgi:hypothetical protein
MSPCLSTCSTQHHPAPSQSQPPKCPVPANPLLRSLLLCFFFAPLHSYIFPPTSYLPLPISPPLFPPFNHPYLLTPQPCATHTPPSTAAATANKPSQRSKRPACRNSTRRDASLRARRSWRARKKCVGTVGRTGRCRRGLGMGRRGRCRGRI